MSLNVIVYVLLNLLTVNAFCSCFPHETTSASSCSSVPKNYQHVLALAFAVNEISENPHILPNISLGFHILNSYYTAKMTFKATLNLLSTQHRLLPNYKCHDQTVLIAIIGGCLSEISANVAILSSIWKTPQITYGSFLPGQGGKDQFPFLYQMVPNEAQQYKGVVRLLQHFRWTWIGLCAVDDDKGQRFLQTMVPMLARNLICDAFILRIPKCDYVDQLIEVMLQHWKSYNTVIESKANVVFVYGEAPSFQMLSMLLFLAPFLDLPPLGKVWIVTSHWDFASHSLQKMWDMQTFHGSISFSVHSNQPLGFQRFTQTVRPLWAKEDGFIQDFWEQSFSCLLKLSDGRQKDKVTCSGDEKLESLPGSFFEIKMTGHSYNVYNAVYTVAQALHAIYETSSKHRRLAERESPLHQFLSSISFNNNVGDTVHFNEKGELVAEFDVTNWLMFPNGSVGRVKVGSLDPQAPAGEELTIDNEQISWHTIFNQVMPISMCNDHCYPGSSRKKKEQEKFCCHDCAPCPEGMISHLKDMNACIKCLDAQYPNKEQAQCLPKSLSYLSYTEALGFFLASLAILFSFITILVLGTFLKHKDTPIVKANNRSITYILLTSLLLCFLSTLLFIGQPGKGTCLLRQTVFSTVFSMALSSILAKTITVLLAFMATKERMGKGLAYSITLGGSLIQAAICALWLGMKPPFPDMDLHSLDDKIILECNEGSSPMFYCVLGYLGSLAKVSFTVAFLARNLPDTFNEAKFITFSMLVFCSVWLSFVPAYLSTKGKHVVAVEIFAILSSSAGLLGCIFGPKCYIIVLRPELNNREHLIRRKN
uniref:G-protein coupled receptors family 3 profile domain-containing protein n=1 Tax=Varanus komodoensis TaxID=61221 RepID=A0A8D2IT52_VARKO